MTDEYYILARAFAESNGIQQRREDVLAQWEVVKEEMGEMEEAFDEWEETGEGMNVDLVDDLVGEMADVLFTIHLMAYQLDADLWTRYYTKSMYNMQKSGKRDENGKIIDDANHADD